jgi:hypothetical protein
LLLWIDREPKYLSNVMIYIILKGLKVAQTCAAVVTSWSKKEGGSRALHCGRNAFVKATDQSQTAREAREDCEAKMVRLEKRNQGG